MEILIFKRGKMAEQDIFQPIIKNKLKICDECNSEYKAEISKMMNLCPECSHWLYEYENCPHKFENGKCIYCYWNGSQSAFIKEIKKTIKK